MNTGLLVLLFCLCTLVCIELLSVLSVFTASNFSLQSRKKKKWRMRLEKCGGQTKKGLVSLFRLSHLCLEFIPTSPTLSPCLNNCIAFKVHLKYQVSLSPSPSSPTWFGSAFQIVSPLQTETPSLIF